MVLLGMGRTELGHAKKIPFRTERGKRRRLPKSSSTEGPRVVAEQPDGRTVLSRLVVYKLGVRVATLSETIRKVS
jgi:hypothetical protein